MPCHDDIVRSLYRGSIDWPLVHFQAAADDVTISVTGVETITHGTGDNTINSLTTNANAILVINGGSSLLISSSSTNAGTLQAGGASPGTINFNSDVLNNTGGVLNADVGGLITVSGVSVVGGSLNSVGTGRFAATLSNNFLDAVTLNGTLDLANAPGSVSVINGFALNGSINVNNGSVLAFEGNQDVSGNGSIVLGDTTSYNRISIGGDSTLTLGSGILLHGQNGTIGEQTFMGGSTNALVNQGTISADVNGGVISLVANSTVNNGTLQALNGGTLALTGNVTGGVGSQIDGSG